MLLGMTYYLERPICGCHLDDDGNIDPEEPPSSLYACRVNKYKKGDVVCGTCGVSLHVDFNPHTFNIRFGEGAQEDDMAKGFADQSSRRGGAVFHAVRVYFKNRLCTCPEKDADGDYTYRYDMDEDRNGWIYIKVTCSMCGMTHLAPIGDPGLVIFSEREPVIPVETVPGVGVDKKLNVLGTD